MVKTRGFTSKDRREQERLATRSKDRREQERLATRAKILEAAREMFARQGVEATTMRAIADRIGYTATAIYYHFRDKDALLTELSYQDFGALARMLAVATAISDPVERLRSIGVGYIEFGLNNPSQYRFMFMMPRKMTITAEEMGVDRSKPEEDAYMFLQTTMAEAITQNRFRPELADAVALSNAFWAALHGVVSLYMMRTAHNWVDFGDPRELGRVTVDALLRGFARN